MGINPGLVASSIEVVTGHETSADPGQTEQRMAVLLVSAKADLKERRAVEFGMDHLSGVPAPGGSFFVKE